MTGSGAAQSLRPVSAAASVSSRAASCSSLHFGCVPCASRPVGRGVSLHEARRPRTSRAAYTSWKCGVGVQGHTRSGAWAAFQAGGGYAKEKGPGPCGSRASDESERSGARQARHSPGGIRSRDCRCIVRPPHSEAAGTMAQPEVGLALTVTRRVLTMVPGSVAVGSLERWMNGKESLPAAQVLFIKIAPASVVPTAHARLVRPHRLSPPQRAGALPVLRQQMKALAGKT